MVLGHHQQHHNLISNMSGGSNLQPALQLALAAQLASPPRNRAWPPFFPMFAPLFDRTFRLNIISSQLVIIRRTATQHRPTSPRSIGICKVPPVKTRTMKEVSMSFCMKITLSRTFFEFCRRIFRICALAGPFTINTSNELVCSSLAIACN